MVKTKTSLPIYRRRPFWIGVTLLAVLVVIACGVLVTKKYPVRDSHATANRGKIDVRTQPPGATLTLDGKALSKKSDTMLDTTLGDHTLKLHLDSYDDQEIKVIVRANEPATVEHVFTRKGFTVLPSTKPGETPGLPAASLKTYTNDKFGYQLKYPNDWRVDTDKSGVAHFYDGFSSAKLASKPGAEVEESLSILVLANPKGLDPVGWYKGREEYPQEDQAQIKQRSLTLAGQAAYQYETPYGFVPTVTTVFTKGTNAVVIQQKQGSPERQIYDQLLQTFSFR